MTEPLIRSAVETDAAALDVLGRQTFIDTFVDGFGIPYPADDLAAFLDASFSPEAIRAKPFCPPDASELAALGGPRKGIVGELLALLRDEQQIVEVGPGLFLDFDAEAEVRRRVAERLADRSQITMAELRDLLGTTRKFSVPIGEHLDRIGLTRREGDTRRLGAPAAILAAS